MKKQIEKVRKYYKEKNFEKWLDYYYRNKRLVNWRSSDFGWEIIIK